MADYASQTCCSPLLKFHAANLIELVEGQAREGGAKEAVVWKDGRMSYGELNQEANRIGNWLVSRGVRSGERVGVLLRRQGELIAALLGVMKSGGSYLGLEGGYPRERLEYMVKDAGCRWVITEQKLAGVLNGVAGVELLEIEGLREELRKQKTENPGVALEEHDLAYVIYTSGSTGRPKGVGIEHGSVAVFLEWVKEEFSGEELAGVLASTSVCFDLSVFEMFGTLSMGGRVLLAENVLEYPELEYREEVRLVNTVPSGMRELLELGGLGPQVRTVCLAGEPLPAALAREVWKQGGVRRVLNLYGPTEDTTYSSWAELEKGTADAPAIGRLLPGSTGYVLDEEMELCAAGVEGELYLGGKGLARGYIGKARETAERFVPNRFGEEAGGRLYRTGDRVRRREDGVLEYVGRMDEQVKIRGYRVELGEIERVLEEEWGVEESVVVVKEGEGGERRLVGYYTGRGEGEKLKEGLRRKLPEWMVPSRLVRLEKMVRTANGKRDRRKLAEVEWKAEAGEIGGAGKASGVEEERPRTKLEQEIAKIWCEVLERESVGLDQEFLALGGHSLLATRVVSRIRQLTSSDLPLSAFFRHSSVRSLAAYLGTAPQQGVPKAISDRRLQSAPLSASQKQIWFFVWMKPEDLSYNVPCCIRISGGISPLLLERALNEVVRRQSAFRTGIAVADGRPSQSIVSSLSLRLPVEKIVTEGASDPEEELRKRILKMADRPLDLGSPPLFAARLFEIAAAEWALGLVAHHIIFDEWSLAILVRELSAAYTTLESGDRVEDPLPHDYANFCLWQHENDWSEGIQYWKKRLAGAPSTLRLPTDYPRTALVGAKGTCESFALDDALMSQVNAKAAQENVTMYVLLLAAFQALFASLTGQDDFVLVTAVAGRTHQEFEATIGCFINMMPVRAEVRGWENFSELLKRVNQTALEGLHYQQVPFERLVEELRPAREPGLTPFAQVAFGVQNAPVAQTEVGGRRYRGSELRAEQTRLDLTVWVDQRSGPARISWTYRTDLFLAATIRNFHQRYTRILQRVTEARDIDVASLLSVKEEKVMSTSKALKSFPGRVAPKAINADALIRIEANWMGTPLPALMEAQAPGMNLPQWAGSHRELIEQHLCNCGGILFRGFHVTGVQDFQQFARAVASEVVKYGERSSPRTEIAEGVYTSTDHPPDQPIVLHNEQSYTLNWPMRIMFFCEYPAAKQGRTPLADSRRILARLSQRTIDRFEELGILYVRNYLPGISLPWTEVFQTQDRQEVEEYCRAAMVECEWIENGSRLRTRQLRPAVRTHPQTGQRTWFNHALFFHVTSLPAEVSKSLREAVAEADLPYNTYYGDGSRIEDATLQELRNAYEAETVSFPWERGDVLLLDNMLAAHGREPFEGRREIRAAMVDPFVSLYGKPEYCPAGRMKEAL